MSLFLSKKANGHEIENPKKRYFRLFLVIFKGIFENAK